MSYAKVDLNILELGELLDYYHKILKSWENLSEERLNTMTKAGYPFRTTVENYKKRHRELIKIYEETWPK